MLLVTRKAHYRKVGWGVGSASQRVGLVEGGVMSLRKFGVLVVTVVAGLAVGMPPVFGMEGSGENGRIAFVVGDIWTMTPNGGDKTRLTPGDCASWPPA